MSGERALQGLATRSIRVRTTFVATLTVAIALTLGGVGLVWATRSAQTSAIRTTVQTRAGDIASLVAAGTLPTRLSGRGDGLEAQVISDGKVVAFTPELAGVKPLFDSSLNPGQTRETRAAESELFSEPEEQEHACIDPFLVYQTGAIGEAGPVQIVVVASLESIDKGSAVLTMALLVLLPALLVLISALVWVLTGRALAPVEAIRAQAESIGAHALGRRVPVPATDDEIERLARTVNQMLDRLEASVLSQRRFVADASHELRSPVAAIRTMLEVAAMHPKSVDEQTLREDLLRENTRLEYLTADLLLLAKSDERPFEVGSEHVDFSALLSEEAAAARGRSELEVRLDLCPESAVYGDRTRLARLLRNLLDNALRHAATTVWIGCRIRDKQIVVSIDDDGDGVPLDRRDKIFERFVRLQEARERESGGSGLGLAVCRVIAEDHRGSVACVEPTHDGASFEVRLPLA